MSIDAPTSGDGFDQATQVSEDVDGAARAWISEKVTGFAGAHGGYISAMALRSASSLVPADRPARSLSLRLLAPVRPGEVALHRRLERHGGAMSTVTVRIEQDHDPVALAQVSFGRAAHGISHSTLAMPAVPPPDHCEPLIDKPVPNATAGLLVEHPPRRWRAAAVRRRPPRAMGLDAAGRAPPARRPAAVLPR